MLATDSQGGGTGYLSGNGNTCKIPADQFFYSRNNPHPKRVYHIQGLNNQLVCKVDDFGVCPKEPSKPTSKQEFIKPPRPVTVNIPITTPYPAHIITGIPQPPCKEDSQTDIGLLYSQAWREELRDLTAKVEFTPELTDAKEEEIAKWGTQYAGERRNLSPSPTRPLSRSSSRPSSRAGCARPSLTVAEREVVVLELLSQILQTDSLQAVQQWLLITGAKEKDMVLDLIRMAVANMRFGSAACAATKEKLTSRQPIEGAETAMFRAKSACERRRARSQCQKLDSISEKEPDRDRDLKMLEEMRPLSSARNSPHCKSHKKPKTLGSSRILNVPSSPILDGKLCHNLTDLSQT
ncbi:protein TBATA-like [Scyliorhinus torazame]|uniref:protein TBATA-like n=1 Tax=Scyliorhinus torazame TaxID=75743 RepID=UPI003B58CC44